MQTAQSDLTIVGAHTASPVIYWKGQPVQSVTSLKVANGVVTLTVPQDPILADMAANGIKIVRG